MLVFRQSGALFKPEEPQFLEKNGRDHFSIRKFIAKYQLGSPVAGNFFRAQTL